MSADPIIIVSYESEVLGSGEFWRGAASRIGEIHNICARRLACRTLRDGQSHADGMWRSKLADTAPGAPKGDAL